MKNLFFKTYLTTVCLVLVSFLLLSAVFVGLGRNYLATNREENLRDNVSSVAYTVQVYAASGSELDSLDMKMNLSFLANSTGCHLFLCDADGQVINCSDRQMNCAHLGRTIPAQYLPDVGVVSSQSSDLGDFYPMPHYVVATAVALSGDRVYVFAAADQTELVLFIARFSMVFFLVMLGVLLLALMASWAISRRMARPLREMALAARQFAHGEFSVRVRDDGREDEIGALTSAFNDMAASLEKSEEQRREFIANVSHELKTPMTTISGFADGILDGTIPPEAAPRYLSTISSETKRLNRMVRRMLEVSRLENESVEALRSRSFDLAEAARQTFLNFVDQIEEKRLDVDLQIPEEPVQVLGDGDSITQVIYNLLDNALKFAEPDSTLGLCLWKQEGKAYVSVRDKGPEIPAGELPMLFDRFHKADKSRSQDRDGVGLGLYIVKTILNNHGEDITVTSRSGVTEFVFSMTLK